MGELAEPDFSRGPKRPSIDIRRRVLSPVSEFPVRDVESIDEAVEAIKALELFKKSHLPVPGDGYPQQVMDEYHGLLCDRVQKLGELSAHAKNEAINLARNELQQLEEEQR